MLRYLYSGLLNLYKGTLPEYLQEEWIQYLKRKRYRLKRDRVAWWDSQSLSQESIDVKIQPNLRMRLYFDSQLSKLIYVGDFEQKERQFINAFLEAGDIFVDIGANLGIFSLIAAKRVGRKGQIYAFEPYSVSYQRLIKNIRLNRLSNVSSYQTALSSKSETLDMTIAKDGFDAWNSLAHPIAGTAFETERIHSITWDSFVHQHDLAGRVTMMKIDVEGWETHVLSGGTETLSRPDAPILQVEFTEQASRSANSSCKALYALLERLGYQMFVYEQESNQLIPDPLRQDYPYLNLIAAKQPELVNKRLKTSRSLRWAR